MSIARGGWNLIKVVSAFNLSLSITLALATFGYVRVQTDGLTIFRIIERIAAF